MRRFELPMVTAFAPSITRLRAAIARRSSHASASALAASAFISRCPICRGSDALTPTFSYITTVAARRQAYRRRMSHGFIYRVCVDAAFCQPMSRYAAAAIGCARRFF